MTRVFLSAVLAATVTTALPASANSSPMRENVKNQLPIWGFGDVDVDSLSSSQVVHINHLLHSNKSPSQIRGNIGAILGDSALTFFGIKR